MRTSSIEVGTKDLVRFHKTVADTVSLGTLSSCGWLVGGLEGKWILDERR